jgi:ribosomal protein S27AE
MGKQVVKRNFIVEVYQEKCPNCKQGTVFTQNKRLFRLPEMFQKCGVCNYKFEREPGYFIGAMYLSYGLAVLQGLISFFLTYYFFPNLSVEWLICVVILTILLFAKKNFKWSRILYIHIFPW